MWINVAYKLQIEFQYAVFKIFKESFIITENIGGNTIDEQFKFTE